MGNKSLLREEQHVYSNTKKQLMRSVRSAMYMSLLTERKEFCLYEAINILLLTEQKTDEPIQLGAKTNQRNRRRTTN